MSEGIDFADFHCRAVVIVGIPYPPLMDARIILKKRFLNDRALAKKSKMTADEWYRVEARGFLSEWEANQCAVSGCTRCKSGARARHSAQRRFRRRSARRFSVCLQISPQFWP